MTSNFGILYTKLARRDNSTVYYAQNNSRACEIMLANEILTLLWLYLRLWSMGSGKRPKMQGTSVIQIQESILKNAQNAM